jgi:mRNA interferase MazF
VGYVPLAAAPGHVLCLTRTTGLCRDSVVNVAQLITVDKSLLTEGVGMLPARILCQVEVGLWLVLSL